MNNKIKVIFVSSVSASLFLNSGRGDINKLTKENWHSLTAIEIKKRNPCLEIECWSPEIKYKKEKKFKELGIKYCIFPSDLVIRPGMEVCLRMVHKLNSEIKKSQENNQKLIIHLHEYHSWQIYLILLLLKRKKNVKIIAQHHGGRNPFANLRKYKRLALFLPLISLMQFFEHLLFKKVDVFYALGDLEINYLKKIAPNSEIRFQSVGIEEEYFKVA